MEIKKGIGVSPGVVVCTAIVLDAEDLVIPKRQVDATQVPLEIERFHQAFQDDDATAFARLLEGFPAMKARINDPVLSFDSPAIIHVRSRAMLDVLLDRTAD